MTVPGMTGSRFGVGRVEFLLTCPSPDTQVTGLRCLIAAGQKSPPPPKLSGGPRAYNSGDAEIILAPFEGHRQDLGASDASQGADTHVDRGSPPQGREAPIPLRAMQREHEPAILREKSPAGRTWTGGPERIARGFQLRFCIFCLPDVKTWSPGIATCRPLVA